MKVNPPIIVIFGAAIRPDGSPSEALRHRVDAAARFGQQIPNPRFIPTGAKGRHGDAEATVMARLLTAKGVPPDAITEERTATDTLSSVRAIRRMVPRGAAVHACTSAYHLPRCLLLLRLAGINAKPCPPPAAPAATNWFWALREAAALPYDAILMIWLRATGRL